MISPRLICKFQPRSMAWTIRICLDILFASFVGALLFFGCFNVTPVAAQVPEFDTLKHLYDYQKTPFDERREEILIKEEGVAVYQLSFSRPSGERTYALLVSPTRSGRSAGIVCFGTNQEANTLLLAKAGAVSLIIEPPNFPENASAEQYRDAMIRIVIDIRRAADWLSQRNDIKKDRLGYIGHSMGAMLGAVVLSLDKRFKAAVFQSGELGMSYNIRNSPNSWAEGLRARLGAGLQQYLKVLAPVDAEHYVGRDAPAALLFQSGRLEPSVAQEGATAFFQKASEPKQLRWYNTGHDVASDITANVDCLRFLAQHLGLNNLDAVIQGSVSSSRH
jgi:dienelactone hydrolase